MAARARTEAVFPQEREEEKVELQLLIRDDDLGHERSHNGGDLLPGIAAEQGSFVIPISASAAQEQWTSDPQTIDASVRHPQNRYPGPARRFWSDAFRTILSQEEHVSCPVLPSLLLVGFSSLYHSYPAFAVVMVRTLQEHEVDGRQSYGDAFETLPTHVLVHVGLALPHCSIVPPQSHDVSIASGRFVIERFRSLLIPGSPVGFCVHRCRSSDSWTSRA